MKDVLHNIFSYTSVFVLLLHLAFMNIAAVSLCVHVDFEYFSGIAGRETAEAINCPL